MKVYENFSPSRVIGNFMVYDEYSSLCIFLVLPCMSMTRSARQMWSPASRNRWCQVSRHDHHHFPKLNGKCLVLVQQLIRAQFWIRWQRRSWQLSVLELEICSACQEACVAAAISKIAAQMRHKDAVHSQCLWMTPLTVMTYLILCFPLLVKKTTVISLSTTASQMTTKTVSMQRQQLQFQLLTASHLSFQQ